MFSLREDGGSVPSAPSELAKAGQSSGDIALEQLYPALLQCFVVILSGYAAGRLNLISETEAKGLNTFVSLFSLPSLIFLSLAELDLSSVKWQFLGAVLLAKGAVFLVVVVVTLLVSRPLAPGRAGLFAIFCTQSNDFAVGYPIVAALYEKVHPEYASYLYLMAPISLVILNPLGCILMEIGKHYNLQEQNVKVKKLRLIATVAKSIIKNPVVFMTILGMLGNLIFSHNLPLWIHSILQVFGSAFAATALFLLGLRMVGKWHSMQGTHLLVPCILVVVKLVALPLVIREVVSQSHAGVNVSDNLDLSTYGFLYGTFPAAPGVFVYALHYGQEVDLIAIAMVACTFISAPWMFVSARMITIDKVQPSKDLDNYSFDISIVGIIASAWLLVMFVYTGKYRKALHRITCCLLISQLLMCVGAVLWTVLGRASAWSMYLQFAVYAVGVHSSRLWTVFLAAALHLLHARSLCFVLRAHVWFIVLGFGLPLVMATVIMVAVESPVNDDTVFISFQYGVPQAAVSSCFMIVCFITPGPDAVDIEDLVCLPAVHGDQLECRSVSCGDCDRLVGSAREGEVRPGDVCPSALACSSPRRAGCEALVAGYRQKEEEDDDHQAGHHQVLLLLLALSLFVGIAVSVWTAVMDEISGIYVELAFLDATLNLGQSVLVFAVFFCDNVTFLASQVNRWHRRWTSSVPLVLPPLDELDSDTRHVCEQFVTHHLDKCRREVAHNKRCRLHFYKDVFKGTELVDWLVLVGLARERAEAVQYASQLLDGRVIRHVHNLHHFLDSSLLYTFKRSLE
ncbi:lysosomal cholesterol signaling protein isoform X2 [Bacillus rossius redtenbacheri]|uniref:lysosomal cholesterol signaling protein isoform X2 n=1 Tax=Bacillus rossius redtenbacheri TaxID=93214 RepID=UPI002FDEB5A1